jgi:hypothetical protein
MMADAPDAIVAMKRQGVDIDAEALMHLWSVKPFFGQPAGGGRRGLDHVR